MSLRASVVDVSLSRAPMQLQWAAESTMARVALASGALFLLVLGLCAAAQNPPQSKPANVAGEWVITFDDLKVKSHPILTLKQEGDKVAGTWGRAPGKGDKLKGTVEGAFLSMKGGNWIIPIELTAVLRGELLIGTIKVVDRDFTWTAKRQPAPPQASPSPPGP